MKPFTTAAIISAIFLSGCGAPYVYDTEAQEKATRNRLADRLEWYQRHGGDSAHFQY
jgi:PBP1b-binding outer membrane lipoprotein LpoB